MFRLLLIVMVVSLAGCSGRSWNTTVADTTAVRAAMVASVIPGITTDKAFVVRWGKPTQIVREGGQESYIYRNLSNPDNHAYKLQFGDSTRYVIVDFQYGIAVAARSTETVGCRATFPPRPPSYALDTPSTVHPVNCGRRPLDGGGRLSGGTGPPVAGKY